MPFVPAPSCAQVELRFLLGGQKVENVFHYKAASPFDGFQLVTLCGLMQAWWETNVQPWVASAMTLREIYAFGMDEPTSPAYTLPMSPPIAGGNTQDPLPNNVAMCLSGRSSFRGRSARGRSYLCGLVDIQAAGSQFTSTVVGQALDAYANLIGPMSAEGFDPVIVSKRTGGAWRTTAEIFDIIAWTLVDEVVDSQRRRLPGRGK